MTFKNAGLRGAGRDGQEAWEKLCDGFPCDIVFCDIEMPKMNGLDCYRGCRKSPNKLSAHAMLTDRGADRHRQMAVELGARLQTLSRSPARCRPTDA